MRPICQHPIHNERDAVSAASRETMIMMTAEFAWIFCPYNHVTITKQGEKNFIRSCLCDLRIRHGYYQSG